MTIAISLKVHDGVILASDSAATLVSKDKSGNSIINNVYNNANKVFNLYKGLPIGCITWGAGSMGNASISTLAKDLRRQFMGDDRSRSERKLVKEKYTLERVAQEARKFFYEETYLPEYKKNPFESSTGFIIAGYSAGEGLAEEWQFTISNGNCTDPQALRPRDVTGVSWRGEPEAIQRLLLGFGTGLAETIKNMGLPEDQIDPVISNIRDSLEVQFAQPPMPIKDAIDLAEYLVHTTIMYSRFSAGAPTVGGPIEIAAITKHEHFKWVKRKHYFDAILNPIKE